MVIYQAAKDLAILRRRPLLWGSWVRNVRERITRLTHFTLPRVLGNRQAVWESLAGELTGRPAVMLGDPTCGPARRPSPTPGPVCTLLPSLVLVLPSHSLPDFCGCREFLALCGRPTKHHASETRDDNKVGAHVGNTS